MKKIRHDEYQRRRLASKATRSGPARVAAEEGVAYETVIGWMREFGLGKQAGAAAGSDGGPDLKLDDPPPGVAAVAPGEGMESDDYRESLPYVHVGDGDDDWAEHLSNGDYWRDLGVGMLGDPISECVQSHVVLRRTSDPECMEQEHYRVGDVSDNPQEGYPVPLTDRPLPPPGMLHTTMGDWASAADSAMELVEMDHADPIILIRVAHPPYGDSRVEAFSNWSDTPCCDNQPISPGGQCGGCGNYHSGQELFSVDMERMAENPDTGEDVYGLKGGRDMVRDALAKTGVYVDEASPGYLPRVMAAAAQAGYEESLKEAEEDAKSETQTGMQKLKSQMFDPAWLDDPDLEKTRDGYDDYLSDWFGVIRNPDGDYDAGMLQPRFYSEWQSDGSLQIEAGFYSPGMYGDGTECDYTVVSGFTFHPEMEPDTPPAG